MRGFAKKCCVYFLAHFGVGGKGGIRDLLV